ncbi:hypothetical protein [Streptomyces catenulae]|uniref:PPE family protein n=1 Tax=Streptomyces catenulae TaxID=66875 RepID=A0ABV2YU16_9ACTN|nr:hypothetical protein [Streptomyces catenulae]
MVDAAEEHRNAQAMERNRKAEERSDRLKSFQGHRLTPTSPSDFHHRGINELRSLVEHAKPGAIESSGEHWRASADRLAGHDGTGGIRKAFMAAVDHASEHWEGTAANAFRREAAKVLKKIDKTYQHARVVERTLIGTRGTGPEIGVAHSLRKAQQAMAKIKDPGKVESAFNASGDDAQFHKDMANPKMDARMALELNRDELSLSKERQVEAVIVMDELAANYDAHSKVLEESVDPGGVHGDWPKEPSTRHSPPPVNMPDTGGHRPTPSVVQPNMPNGGGGHAVPPGFDGPTIKRPEIPVQTGLDGLQGGTLTPPPVAGGTIGGGGVPGGHSTGTPGGTSGGMVPPGFIGMPGGRGASGGGRGASVPGGMGRPGGAGGLGAGGKGAAAGARGGAQARTRGGVVGKPGGPAGGAKQGGSGLHRSRGGSQAGKGMAGAGAGGKDKGKRKNEGPTNQRPDYLVEDEETWNSQRKVAPRVIE